MTFPIYFLKAYCIVPVFGPALENTYFVLEYVWKLKNHRARNTSYFSETFQALADPSSLCDMEIWSIILDVTKNFDFFSANTASNPMWKIFTRSDATVKKITGLMLASNRSALSSSMLAVSRVQLVVSVPTASTELLLRILKWIWMPVVATLHRSIAAHFECMSFEEFKAKTDDRIDLPDKRSLQV